MVREHCASMLPFTIPQTAVERYKKLWQNGGVRYGAGDLCVLSSEIMEKESDFRVIEL